MDLNITSGSQTHALAVQKVNFSNNKVAHKPREARVYTCPHKSNIAGTLGNTVCFERQDESHILLFGLFKHAHLCISHKFILKITISNAHFGKRRIAKGSSI